MSDKIKDSTTSARSACNGLLGAHIMIENKRCLKCGTIKAVSLFSKDRSRKDGYHPYCKKCKAINDKTYREYNKGKVKTKRIEYYKKNRGKILVYQKKYAEKNKDKIAIYKLKYREENIEKIKKSQRERYFNYKNTDYAGLCERRKKYRLNRKVNNPEKLRNEERNKYLNWRKGNPLKYKIHKKRNAQAAICKLADRYIKKLLKRDGVIDPPAWLINVKRQQILLNRRLKK